jgi:hypothetical protein
MQSTSQRLTLTRISLLALMGLAGSLAMAVPVTAVPLCTADATTLCIDQEAGDGRWQIKLDWATTLNNGSSGHAHAVPLDAVGIFRGGLFWIFSASNPELIVKVIDGCDYNNRAWIYFAATTNVGYTLTVTDMLYPTHVWTRTNADLHLADPVADIQAFTCDGTEPDPIPTEPWILTTRPGHFFTATPANPTFRVDIPVDADEIFYKITVEVEVDMNGYSSTEPAGKHNIFSIWHGDNDLRGDSFGELGLYGGNVNELELLSNADLSGDQRETRTHTQALDPNGVYSFLMTYDVENHKTKSYVYQGSHVGQNLVFNMFGDATGNNPILTEGDGFSISFGSQQGGGLIGNQVPSYGWSYSNLKVYLERPVD